MLPASIFVRVFMPRLPASSLWLVVRSLGAVEMRQLWFRVKKTRLGWLLRTLRQMEDYSEERLMQVYQETFPGADQRLLRVYKRQLWDVLEETLPSRESSVGREVRIWQRLWLSVLLWERGLGEIAGILWRQVVEETIRLGWYEVALWGISLLELYERDFHHISREDDISEWVQNILRRVVSRYEAASMKITALEDYRLSDRPRTWNLPCLPSEEAWGAYLQKYADLIAKARKRRFDESLSVCLEMIDILMKTESVSPLYRDFQMALTYANLGIILTNMGEWSIYEKWFQLWEESWQSRYWSPKERYRQIHRAILAIRLSSLIRTGRWHDAYDFWRKERINLENLIFNSGESVSFRANRACGIFFILTLKNRSEAINWAVRVEAWMEREGFRELPYLWWHFLRWFEAWQTARSDRTRYWYRKLKAVWKAHFMEDERWKPVLALLRVITTGASETQVTAHTQFLFSRWEERHQERERWEKDRIIFPMIMFVQSLRSKTSLEAIVHIMPDVGIEPLLLRRVEDTLGRFEQAISSRRLSTRATRG